MELMHIIAFLLKKLEDEALYVDRSIKAKARRRLPNGSQQCRTSGATKLEKEHFLTKTSVYSYNKTLYFFLEMIVFQVLPYNSAFQLLEIEKFPLH